MHFQDYSWQRRGVFPRNAKKERLAVKTRFVCSDLEVDSSLVGQVSLVAWQSDDYIRASLSLQFLYPVLCPCKGLLQVRENRVICQCHHVISNLKRYSNLTVRHFYICNLYAAKASSGHSFDFEVSAVRLRVRLLALFRLGYVNVPHLWCRRPRWRPVLLCNT